jgi:hypothetical protein
MPLEKAAIPPVLARRGAQELLNGRCAAQILLGTEAKRAVMILESTLARHPGSPRNLAAAAAAN